MKIAIIGAGSTYTPELIEGIIGRKDKFPVTEIAMMDINKRKLDIVGGLTRRMVKAGEMGATITTTNDLSQALHGASFVFSQIRVGMLPARVLDEAIPKKYHLLGQETTGIGGFFKALRTVPVMMNIATEMTKHCPDAFMINFANPSGINAQTLLNHTSIKMLGLCNAPISMMSIAKRALDIDDAELDYVGLNHLSVITSIRHAGRDYLREAVAGNDEILAKLSDACGFEKEDIRLIEGIPVGYMNYFLHPRRTLFKHLSDKTTRGQDCMVIEDDLLKMFQDEKLCVKPDELSKRGGAMYSEAAVSLAESIYLDDGKIHIVNTLNNGAIPFMAPDDAVETRAYAGKNGAATIPVQTSCNPLMQNIMCSVKTYERYTVTAALNGCKTSAIRALMANPLVQDMEIAIEAFEEMLQAHKEYLPQFF